MAEIIDEGKVWFKGNPGPTYAIRVDEKYFVIGKSEDDHLERWVDGNNLCVDLHNKNEQTRVVRIFQINSVPSIDASLFSGFENTKHAAVKVVVPEDPRVQQFILKDDNYAKVNASILDSKSFLEAAKQILKKN
jgi:hypothetical protein